MKFWIKEKKGEVTAFLSLVLLLILSLIGTVIEGARINIAKVYASRALTTSMGSVLGEYFYPMYEDYHLFFLDGGYGTREINLPQMAEIMEEYMEFSLNPSKEYTLLGHSFDMPTMNLYDVSIDNISIEDTVRAMDLENKMFIHEAVGFMKYKLPANLIETAGEKYTNSETSVQVSDIMEKKINLEESAYTLSESMLDLIRYIEGISVDKRGIHYKNNLIKTEKNFVKKFCVGAIDKNSLAISQDVVFESLMSSYQTPIVWLNEIIGYEKNIKIYKEQIENLKNELESISDDDEGSEERKAHISSKINELENKKNKSLENIKFNVNRLIDLTEGTQNKISAALKVIPSISINQEKAANEVKLYEEYLSENKENVDEKLYNELNKDSNKMKEYINNLGEKKEYNLSKNRLAAIQNALSCNYGILEGVYAINNIPINEAEESINQMILFTTNLSQSLKAYDTKDLWFDYSSLKIDPNVKNPVTYFKELINDGVLNLVVKDLSAISKRELSGLDLPSKLIEKNKGEQVEEEISNNISHWNEDDYRDNLKSSFGEYAKESKEEIGEINNSNELLEMVLLNEYIIEHFKNQSSKTNEKTLKKTMLEYEQEYILNGNLKDYDNFSDIVHKLLFTRTIMNFVYLFTDSEKSGLAYATAAALVGFTCLEPLISLTKMAILLIWAYEEALVDTTGLLENKYIPFIKGKSNFAIQYSELLLMNKKLIQEKVTKLSDKRSASYDMNYDEYIRVFLYLMNQNMKCKRMMDLIQENIRYKYEENFLMENCIYGYKVKAEFYIGAKFIKLPFVNKILNSDIQGYKYDVTKEYSY
ncbi:hypothetical protein EDD66_11366 [Mobilisporobacter senegalensis]|uniref:Uncharacterized protein n=1 Tax=Mobilisporobacter senegalensis TaxID=1329262 RepID=A0A3N1XC40_9FIRM|nr:DUF5702 domain-containing protein [Mobilisporobacter senegalensis]ROR23671.1 hypothetical protein EDD66_11366 [Mobilisporobacter senegalensis]